jgi:hypothetical protein
LCVAHVGLEHIQSPRLKELRGDGGLVDIVNPAWSRPPKRLRVELGGDVPSLDEPHEDRAVVGVGGVRKPEFWLLGNDE